MFLIFTRFHWKLTSVIWIRDPERCWRDISHEKRTGSLYEHSQVVLYCVTSLYTILDEEGVAHNMIGDVVFDYKTSHAMYCHGAVKGVMYCAAADVRSRNVTTQVKMDWVATWK